MLLCYNTRVHNADVEVQPKVYATVKPEHMHREGTTRNSDPVGLLCETCI